MINIKWMVRICAPSFSHNDFEHNGFEMAKTDGNRLQCIVSKPGKRAAAHNLRNITIKVVLSAVMALIFVACDTEGVVDLFPEEPQRDIYRIPVVVHVVHRGEAIGEGTNLSIEQIQSQIRVLNEDYRRKVGTRGYNEHPDGGDARIEFTLAKTAPDGTPTDGVVRINFLEQDVPEEPVGEFNQFAGYSYWSPEHYVNVWVVPFVDLEGLFLGKATGPETDLPGGDEFEQGEPIQAEGIIVNSVHFGESNSDSEYNLGRTLTHEMGHYLGLLHPWGSHSCETNDYCDDTPPVSEPVTGCPGSTRVGCDGRPVMMQNFMNWSPDRCMNTFTNDQIARMHYVLEHSPRRNSLLDSPGLEAPPAE